MGSFHLVCGVSGVTICPGDRAVVFFLRPQRFRRAEKPHDAYFGHGLFVSNDGPSTFYELDSMGISCEYDDYGRFILDTEAPALTYYNKTHELGLTAELDVQEHSVFVVRGDVYEFVTCLENFKNPYADKWMASVEKRYEGRVARLRATANKALGIIEAVELWAIDIDDAFADAYDELYRTDHPAIRRAHREKAMLESAMWRTNRFYGVPLCGGQEDNAGYLRDLYTTCAVVDVGDGPSEPAET
jgi:hypothetical protein